MCCPSHSRLIPATHDAQYRKRPKQQVNDWRVALTKDRDSQLTLVVPGHSVRTRRVFHLVRRGSVRWRLKRTAPACARLSAGVLGLDRIPKHRPLTSVLVCRPRAERSASV